MKRLVLKISIICVLITVSERCFAQTILDKDFKEYCQHIKEDRCLKVKSPKGFTQFNDWENGVVLTGNVPYGYHHSYQGDAYGPVFQSKDGQCRVCYSNIIFSESAKTKIYHELESNLIDASGIIPSFNVSDYLDSISCKGLKEDVIYYYDYPHFDRIQILYDTTETNVLNGFQHAAGLMVARGNVMLIRLKLFFTNDGFENKDCYIDRILNSIKQTGDELKLTEGEIRWREIHS